MLKELGVTPVKIDLPFRLNHVNCFLAEGENGFIIIDAGLHNDISQKAWQRALHGKEVERIMITHYHPDHYGNAGTLQHQTGAPVWMTETDAKIANVFLEPETIETFRGFYIKCGVPAQLIDKLSNHGKEFRMLVTPHAEVHHFIKEGTMVQIGKLEYETLFTPGHADGLICFYNKEKKVLFSTDHVLSHITPNISYNFFASDNPLANYFKSLEKVRRLEINYAIPSHGDPFYHVNSRIEELIAHHHERLAVTYEITKGDVTVLEACHKLFRHDLNVHEIRFAIGEAMAHLEYLYYNGDCIKEEKNGRWYYKNK